MLIKPGSIRTWLYTSQFKNKQAAEEVTASVCAFGANNKRFGMTGFLITNGKSVMQLLEGDDTAVETMKRTIEVDKRHFNVISEVWDLEDERAYPHWSMRALDSDHYETLFKEIESARIATIATNIARMLFDDIFES